MDKEKRIQWMADHAPALREKEVRAINGLFDAYLFRRKRTGELWTTCCGRYLELKKGDRLTEAEHRRFTPYWQSNLKGLPPLEACPVCGRKAAVKELGRTGDRKNLWDYVRCVVLRKGKGCVWALGIEAVKDYSNENALTDKPFIKVIKIYRFAPGLAEQIGRDWFWGNNSPPGFRNYQRVEGVLKSGWIFQEGLPFTARWGTGYKLIDLDGLEGTHLQYCQREKYDGWGDMRYLALASIYPRQVEMLMKAGLVEIVSQMVAGQTNGRVMKWAEPDPVKSFGLTRPELAEWIAYKGNVEVLKTFKRMRKAGLEHSFRELCEMRDYAGQTYLDRFARKMVETGLRWERLHNYLEKERQAMKGKKPTTSDMTIWWLDYLDAAKELGYDLSNDVYRMPKDLLRHHDEATRTAQALRMARAREEQTKREGERLASLCKKYTYAEGDWIILPPVTAQEIVEEGRALQHCVGGYADRHVRGVVTILFLRSRKEPNVPRVTIEMAGDTIAQIHGYANELKSCKENPKRLDPREIYREFLDSWLEWLKAGSKRDKKGRPVLPKKKKEVHAA